MKGLRHKSGLIFQNAVSATGNGTAYEVIEPSFGSWHWLDIQVTGTFTATLTVEGTLDGTNWFAVAAVILSSGAYGATITATGGYRADVSGFLQVRVRVTWTSGTSVTVRGTLVTDC